MRSKFDDDDNLSNEVKLAVSQTDAIELRQAYNMLSAEEKQSLWSAKLIAILKNDDAKLTSEQKKIVLMIQSFCMQNNNE